MIIYKSGDAFTFETRSGKPFEDFSGGRALYVIDEADEANAALIADIRRLAPFFKVECDGGKVISVADDAEARAAHQNSHEPPVSADERISELYAALELLLSEVVE